MEKKHFNNVPFTEINEILGKPPNWIVRWGNTLILLIFLLFLTISWIIQYPDVIESNFVLQSKKITTDIIANSSGHIQEIFYQDNQSVKNGDVIGLINSTSDYQSIIGLEQNVLNFIDGKSFDLSSKHKNLKLGELQPYYSQF